MRPIIAQPFKSATRFAARVAAILFVATAAGAAGIDCDKAATRTEATICANGDLMKLDQDLAVAYRGVLDTNPSAASLKSVQREWISTRDAGCRTNKACLIATYEDRIKEFRTLVDINAAADGI